MIALRNIAAVLILSFALSGSAVAQSENDPFYLPQATQPFEGKVDTRIGALEFSNQYPSKESMQTILDSMAFHGATQAYLWGIPIASFANMQHYNLDVFKVRQGELVQFVSLKERLGILTGNATTPYILGTASLLETGPFVIDIPAGAIGGMVDDFWQRPVTDVGLVGPDKGKGAKWKIALGLDPSQRATNYEELDERAEWFYEAISSSKAMVTTTPGVGSTYLASYADKDGDWLDGAKSYTLHIPAKPPAEQFWSIAVYSWDSRTLIDNDQKRSAHSSRQDLIMNDDGSVDFVLRTERSEGQREELGPDHSRTRLVGLSAFLRALSSLLRQELEHGRFRKDQITRGTRTKVVI